MFGNAATSWRHERRVLTRRIGLYLASNWPSALVFAHAMSQLRSP